MQMNGVMINHYPIFYFKIIVAISIIAVPTTGITASILTICFGFTYAMIASTVAVMPPTIPTISSSMIMPSHQ